MKHLTILSLFILFFLSCKNTKIQNQTTEKNDEIAETVLDDNPKETIANVFEEVKNGMLKNNGNKLYKVSDEKSKKYYNTLLTNCLKADSTFVRNQNIFDKLFILFIRGKFNKTQLEKMNEKDLFISYYNFSLNNFMVKDWILLDVNIKDNLAHAKLNSRLIRYKENKPLLFTKEKEEWKFDFTSLYKVHAKTMTKMLEASEGETEDEYLSYSLRMQKINKPYKELWKPLSK